MLADAADCVGGGVRIAVRLGNGSVAAYGEPLAVQAEVVRLFAGGFTYSGGIMGGAAAAMGPSAWLRIGKADVVVATNPTYEYGDEQFQAAGFDPRTRRFVIAKNPMNYQQAFAGASATFILDTPGPTTSALARIAVPRARASRPFWPFERDFAPEVIARPIRPRRNH